MAFVDDQTTALPTPVPVKKVKSDGSCDNATALAIVLADMRADEAFIAAKMWALRWREIDGSASPLRKWNALLTGSETEPVVFRLMYEHALAV